MKKIQQKKFSHGKIAIFLVVVCFVWLQISFADDDNLNYFEDADQDGLTDQEEVTLGTDPQKEDTDGDGYSDAVEIESGYDPLIASPDDRIVEDVNEETSSDNEDENVNMTEEFFQKLSEEKPDEVEALKLLSADPDEFSQQMESGELSDVQLTEDDIKELVDEVTDGVDVVDEMEIVPEEEINILPEVEEKDEEEKKDEEKKQIEEYFVKVGYVVFENAPFLFENEDNLSGTVTSLITDVDEDIENGDKNRVVDIRQRAESVHEQLKEIEVPYVMKDIHQMGLSLFEYSLGQDESVLFGDEDPLGSLSLIGKMQGVMGEITGLEGNVFDMLEKYDLESFDIPKEIQP